MTEISDFLESGDAARLIPVVADTSKEARATSALLAAIVSVEPLARCLLGTLGQRVGSRAKLDAYTEVVFAKRPENSRIRPDGLLVVSVGKRSWSALFEAKVGRARLDEEQIAKYCQLARLNNIQAIITISNEFSALPTHHPLKLQKQITKNIDLYHWSWMSVLTHASLLLNDDEFNSPGEKFILSEVVRYFRHPSVGISSFDRMNGEWKDLALKVQSGAVLNKTSPEVQNSVAAWHQEQRDLSLLMSRKLSRHVALRLSRNHANDPVRRLRDDCETLVEEHAFHCTLEVPDAASHIEISADVGRRTLSCGMRLVAPRDKKRSQSRINWFVNQLSKTASDETFVKAIWPGRAADTLVSLEDIRNDTKSLDNDHSTSPPAYFEALMVRDLAGKFTGSKTFVERLEAFVPEFYERIGQHLRAWVPPPPKMVEENKSAPSQDSTEEAEPSVTTNS